MTKNIYICVKHEDDEKKLTVAKGTCDGWILLKFVREMLSQQLLDCADIAKKNSLFKFITV